MLVNAVVYRARKNAREDRSRHYTNKKKKKGEFIVAFICEVLRFLRPGAAFVTYFMIRQQKFHPRAESSLLSLR